MIPLNINRSHIIMALKKIDEQIIPEARKATKYQLVYRGKNYPLKFVGSCSMRVWKLRKVKV